MFSLSFLPLDYGDAIHSKEDNFIFLCGIYVLSVWWEEPW